MLSTWVLTFELSLLLRHPQYNYECERVLHFCAPPLDQKPMRIWLPHLSYPYPAWNWAQSRYSVNVYWGNESPLLSYLLEERPEVVCVGPDGYGYSHSLRPEATEAPVCTCSSTCTRQKPYECEFGCVHVYCSHISVITRGSFLFGALNFITISCSFCNTIP